MRKKTPDVTFSLGRRLDGSGDLLLTEEARLSHMAVLGRTGRGKSRFLNLYMRMLTATRHGFCLIDPHGDLAEDVLAYVGRKRQEGDDALWRRVHYLEPGFETVFAYDPFWFEPPQGVHRDFHEHARRAWVHARVDRVIEILQRKQGQANLEGMPRLQRVLTDVLTAVATAVDARGNHLCLADALVLLDIFHPRHHDVFARVQPFLDLEILADFERWHRMKNPEAFLREAESTINRLRSFMSPIVKAVFSRTGKGGTINFARIVQDREILLVNLRETPFFSSDQKTGLGGMFIHDILQALAQTPRGKRRPFTLIVDEAGEFIGKDMEVALGATRKYGLSCVFGGQDRQTFRKGPDLDMYPKLLGMCGVLTVFQTQWYEDLEALACTLGYGDIDFTPLVNEVERHGGYDWLKIVEWSESVGAQQKWEKGTSASATHGTSDTSGETQSEQRTTSTGLAHQVGKSSSHGAGDSFDRHHEATGGNRSSSEGKFASESRTESSAVSTGTSRTTSHAEQRSETAGTSESVGGGQSATLSRSHKLMPLAHIVREIVETGQLKASVADQFERIKQKIHGLKKRQAVVKLPDEGRSVTIEVHEVRDPFLSAEAQEREVEHLKRLLRQEREYVLVPDLSREGQDRRLSEFAGSPPREAQGTQDTQAPDEAHVPGPPTADAEKQTGKNVFGN
jgi:hypothetical protein